MKYSEKQKTMKITLIFINSLISLSFLRSSQQIISPLNSFSVVFQRGNKRMRKELRKKEMNERMEEERKKTEKESS